MSPAATLGLPNWLCVLALQAVTALDGRAEADAGGYRLDGKPATLRQLVLAAHSMGVPLSYPQVRPHAAAYHAGPSAALPRLARPKPPARRHRRPRRPRKGVRS